MDNKRVREALTELLTEVAEKARADAANGESDIGHIFRDTEVNLHQLDIKAIEEAIKNIDKATATREGTRRLVDGLMMAARVAARIAF